MARIIEAVAKISATDNTGAVFDKIAKKIDSLGKSAKVSSSVDKLSKAMQTAEKQMRAIDKFDAARGGLGSLRRSFADARMEVLRHATAMRGVDKPTNEMIANYKRAQREVAAASRALERQNSIVLSHKRAIETMGIPVGAAAAHQQRLRTAVERTNAALSKQSRNARLWDHNGALGAGAAVAAGYVGAGAVSRGIGRTVAAGAHYQHEVTGLQNVGRTPAEMAQIEAASKRAVAAVPTSTFTENLKVINETTGAFGSLEHAMENLEFVQKANSVIHSVAGDKIQDGPGEMGNKLARFFEMRGTAGDHHVFQKEAEQMVRAMVFTRGNFNPSEMLNFAQQAKAGLQTYDMSFLGSYAPSLVTEMGGDRAGTAANAWRNVLMGKVRDKKQTEAWVKAGLIDKKQIVGGEGSPISWKAGAVKGTDEALKNPFAWTEKYLIPALQKQGVNVDDPLDTSKALATMFRNQNANQFAEQITQLRARTRLHKDKDLMEKVHPLDQIYANNLKTDPTQSLTALTASLENLAATAASPAMKNAAAGINWISEALQATAVWTADHPATAVSAGAAAGGGALLGAGYLSYKLMTGFGLTTSAAALDGAAAALTAAAAGLNGGVAAKAAAAAGGTVAGSASGGLWAAGSAALPYAAAVAGGAYGLWAMYDQTRQYEGMTSGERMKKQRGGSMHDTLRRSFDDDRERLGVPLIGDGSGSLKTELTGSAEVHGEATVRVLVEPSGELLRVVEGAKATAKLAGTLNANGPGSTGKSSPDAGAAPIGAGGSW